MKNVHCTLKKKSQVLCNNKQGHSNRVIVRRTISGRRLASLSASRQTSRFPTISVPIDPDSINELCFSIDFVVFQGSVCLNDTDGPI